MYEEHQAEADMILPSDPTEGLCRVPAAARPPKLIAAVLDNAHDSTRSAVMSDNFLF